MAIFELPDLDSSPPPKIEKRPPARVGKKGQRGSRGRPSRGRLNKRVAPEVWRVPDAAKGYHLLRDVRLDRIRPLIAEIQPGETLWITSANHYNAHDVIEAVVEQIAPCALWTATYSLADPAVRRLVRMQDEGMITTMRAVMNHHMARDRPHVAAQLATVCEAVGVFPVHAKVTALRSATRGVTIVGSANLTASPWVEASVVADSVELADFTIDWIEKILVLAEPFEISTVTPTVRKHVQQVNAALQSQNSRDP